MEEKIKNWRKKLEKQQGLEPGYIEELESHLKDKIDGFLAEGMNEQEAFEKASTRLIDETEELAEEFYQARKSNFNSDPGSAVMMLIPNYVKVAFRQFYRQKGYSVINVAGLAIGIACCLLILLYVHRELSYDTFHEHSDRIYRLVNMSPTSGRPGIAKVNGPWGITAEQNIPKVEEMVRFVPYTTPFVKVGEKSNYETGGLYADPSVFKVLSYDFIAGDPETALQQPGSIVLTESLAESYFGNENPMGKTMLFDGSEEYTVTGVIEDIPKNTHLSFRFLGSMSSLEHPDKDDWIRWNQFYTYLLLDEEASAKKVAQSFTDLLPRYLSEDDLDSYQAGLQPITNIHLESNLWREIQPNSDIAYVYIFSAIALLILLIACVNFTNLATARALNRVKEVGIRKSVGAARSSLVSQFIGESILYTLIASIIAVGLALLVLESFNMISGQHFVPSDLLDVRIIVGLIVIVITVGILAGSYPALFMSGFKPIKSLKGEVKVRGNNLLRGGLVVLQFAIAAGLIMATAVVMKQLDFMQNKNLGFDKEQLVIIRIPDSGLEQEPETIKQELLRNPNITNVSITANFPGGTDYGIPTQPEGVPEDQHPGIRILATDHNFIDTFGMTIAKGRDFSEEISTDAFGAVIINQEAARQLGWKDPVGKRIAMEAINFGPAPVIGVVEDFHFRTMREAINPIMMFIPPENWYAYYVVKIRPDNVDQTLSFLEEKWSEFDPVSPFAYTFFDDYYRSLYEQEQNTEQMLSYFTLLAIIISALGLFGMASFMAEKRTKEIGIRKVLGASTSEIVILMGKQFTKLVAIALIVALPLSYIGMNNWLADFSYRTGIGWMTILITIAGSFLVAWISVSYQSIKAAMMNPVKSLRSE